jgi:hypothetical protein
MGLTLGLANILQHDWAVASTPLGRVQSYKL